MINLNLNPNQTLAGKLIIIFLFGLLVLAVGMIIGLVVHKFGIFKSEKAEQDQQHMIKQEEIYNLEETQPLVLGNQYELQLLLSIDPNIIEINKELLKDNGYDVKVEVTEKANKTLYILKLSGTYSREQATHFGQEIGSKFPDLSGFWLKQIETVPEVGKKSQVEIRDSTFEDSSVIEVQKIESEEIPSLVNPDFYFELQVMADQDIKKVNRVKNLLEKEGYKTKIIEAVVNNITYHRLRLDGKFSLQQGKEMGEKLKKELYFVHDYWLDKIRINN